MSPVTATARKAAVKPAGKPAPARRPRPNLRLVPPSPRAPRAPFVLLALFIVGAGVAALLVLNTVVAQDAFTLHDLDRNAAALAEEEQRLRQEIAALEAPAAVADRATKLGMVPAGDPVFLTMDGTVLGNPVPAEAPPPPPPPPAPKPSASASAKPTASPKP